jgi:hypothetical protein
MRALLFWEERTMSTSLAQEDNYGISLYYPYIHVRDIDWLKCTLLYWDGIRRIVPNNFPPDEKDETRKDVLSVIKAGLLIRTDTTKYVDQARALFFKRAFELRDKSENDSNPQGLDLLRSLAFKAYARVTGNTSSDQESLKKLLEGLKQSNEDGAYIDMWNKKMHHELSALFQEAGLARTVKGADYMMVQKTAADFYMMCLATAMKQKIGSPLVTDSNGYDQMGKFLDFGHLSPNLDHTGVLFDLNIPYPKPESLHDISMRKILSFHEKTENERRRFRKATDKIVAKAAKAQEIDECRYADFVKDEAKEFKDAFESHKSKMETVGVKGLGSLLKIGAPTAITSIATTTKVISPALAINPLSAGILIGTGVAMSLITWWAEVRRQRQDEREKCSWHYVLSLQKTFQ